MNINTEIEKIIKYRNSSLLQKDRKSETELKYIIEQVKSDYKNNCYNFSDFINISLKQVGKVRHVKKYKMFSCEETLCIYLKRTLDRRFHIKYPNRNDYIHSLFDMINALSNMNDFSIYKFDFRDFFNTVSSGYVFKKYLSNASLERYQLDLLQRYVEQTKYAYAGLNTSNIICEIIAKHFDEVLTIKLKHHGLIFYRRYIDDGILIFNKRIDDRECLSIINESIKEVFYDNTITVTKPCKTKINDSKIVYISIRDMKAKVSKLGNNKWISEKFDFLGYEFEVVSSSCVKKNKSSIETKFKYGITQQKIDKYTKKIERIINEYNKDHNIELFRHRIKAFTVRTVYQVHRNNVTIWKTKGFIANYNELRYRMDSLIEKTDIFLTQSILDNINLKCVNIPYFLKGSQEESIYNLKNNMVKNRALLFVEPIGIEKKGLKTLCDQIGISTANKTYDDLVREYLIKVYVGH